MLCLPSHRFSTIVTPLDAERWEESLHGHLNRAFANYITQGQGSVSVFGSGQWPVAPHSRTCPLPRSANTRSTSSLQRNAQWGGFLAPSIAHNQLGAVPKSTPGKYRLIVDLSFPEGHSPNDGILDTLCSFVCLAGGRHTVGTVTRPRSPHGQDG